MKYFAILTALLASLMLGGCATTIRSEVTAFNNWPAALADQSYAFQAPAGADDTLEYRNYQLLLAQELNRLGFHQAAEGSQPQLLVGMQFRTADHPGRVLVVDDPFWYGPGYWGPGYYRPFYRYGYRPFYDPLRMGNMQVEERVVHNYERQLHVTINRVDGAKLYDVTVNNTSRVQATAHVMPALMRSAFAGFPGQSGVPHRVDVTLEAAAEAKDAEPAPAGAKGE